jgi:hypothetical protein
LFQTWDLAEEENSDKVPLPASHTVCLTYGLMHCKLSFTSLIKRINCKNPMPSQIGLILWYAKAVLFLHSDHRIIIQVLGHVLDVTMAWYSVRIT